ncbi:hypothetical protein ABW19_dt0201106 [Dactylella cylindrospora]|nr:hypothetical protein ABW19_dt0201106 [Dactylella cylindrospora]
MPWSILFGMRLLMLPLLLFNSSAAVNAAAVALVDEQGLCPAYYSCYQLAIERSECEDDKSRSCKCDDERFLAEYNRCLKKYCRRQSREIINLSLQYLCEIINYGGLSPGGTTSTILMGGTSVATATVTVIITQSIVPTPNPPPSTLGFTSIPSLPPSSTPTFSSATPFPRSETSPKTTTTTGLSVALGISVSLLLASAVVNWRWRRATKIKKIVDEVALGSFPHMSPTIPVHTDLQEIDGNSVNLELQEIDGSVQQPRGPLDNS